MEVRNICVIGAGVMGHGIAQVAASAGYAVTVNEVDEGVLARGIGQIGRSLNRLVSRGQLTADQAEVIRSRIRPEPSLAAAVAEADLIIEAVTENLAVKQAVFQAVDEHARPEAIIASNTSQYSITLLASFVRNPGRVCGMHFFNPPVLMRLIEIIRGLQTSDETYATVVAVSRQMGKEVVTCKDSQGFITSRLICALALEAMRIVEEGLASPEDVDRACRLGLGHSMGPLETVDLTGLDTALAVSDELVKAFGDRFRAPQTLRNLVRAGRIGQKAGRGLYAYDQNGRRIAGQEG